jgi:hypothetical protein
LSEELREFLEMTVEGDGKKIIRQGKEDLMCAVVTDCYKSVARIRLEKTENTSVCVTVSCKMCRSAIAL